MNNILFEVLKMIVPTLLATIFSLIAVKYKYLKDPIYNLTASRPQIQYYNIQNELELEKLKNGNEHKICYECIVDRRINNETGNSSESIILKRNNVGSITYSKAAYYSVVNNSAIDIAVDGITTYQGIHIQLNNMPELHIPKEKELLLLFKLELKPKEIRIDYGNNFIVFSAVDRPQTLKIIRTEPKK